MVCVPLPTFFAVFRRWRTKLMRRENGTKLKKIIITFDLNLLLAPTRAHQVFICICFLVVSLFMLACFYHGCLMAQRALSNYKQHEGASRWCFKRVYYDAPMVTRPFVTHHIKTGQLSVEYISRYYSICMRKKQRKWKEIKTYFWP